MLRRSRNPSGRTPIRTRIRLVALESRVAPALYTVTTTADENDGIAVGGVSLRDAINAVNAGGDAANFIDFAPSVTGTIDVSANGLILVSASVSVVGPGASDLSVDGNLQTRLFSIDNGTATSIDVSLSGLTLREGQAEGAAPADRGGAFFLANEKLTLSGCVVTGNKSAGSGGAIAIQAGGTVTLMDCQLSQNSAGLVPPLPGISKSGGAIYGEYLGAGLPTNVTVSAARCLFDQNVATRRGGAIRLFAGSTLTLDQCTLTGNSVGTAVAEGGAVHTIGATVLVSGCLVAGNAAGAIAVQGVPTGNGGGLMFDGPTGVGGVTVRNSTVSGNVTDVSGGGIALAAGFTGTLVVQNSTITGNAANGPANSAGGGGIARLGSGAGVISLESSVVAKNSSPNTALSDLSTTGAVSAKSSLIGAAAGAPTFGVGELVDLGGNLAFGADPGLGLLQPNGGGTLTHLPIPGSPLRDAGSNPVGLAVDQRGPGFPRLLGAGVDIGAVESSDVTGVPWAAAGLIPTVASIGGTTVDVTVTYRDDVGINPATIDVNDVAVAGAAGPLTATQVTVSGAATARVAVYRFNAPGGVFDGADNGSYTISLGAGQVADSAGNAVAGGPLGLFAVWTPGRFVVNAANDELTDTDGKLSLREAVVVANKATSSPYDEIHFDPAVFASATTITLTLGQIDITGDTAVMGTGKDKLAVSGNTTDRVFGIDNGSATMAEVSINDLTLRDGKRTGAATQDRGGAILLGSESLTLTNVRLTNNEAAAGGGALASTVTGGSEPVRINLVNVEATDNRAVGLSSTGGAIWLTTNNANTVLTVQGSTLSGNTASRSGGALYCFNNVVTIENSTLSGNEAKGNATTTTNGGGALYFAGSTTQVTIRNSTLSGNKANAGANTAGGAVGVSANFTGTINLLNSTVAFNEATAQGGGLNLNSGGKFTLVVRNSIIARNSAAGGSADDIFQATGANTVSFTYSLLGDTVGTTFTPGVGSKVNLDPLLGPLADNGGPTKTHLLLPGSPARDVGDPAFAPPPAIDQRGFPRVVNGVIDFGSTESAGGAVSPPRVTTVQVNNGAAQRSRVTSVKVSFDQIVSVPPSPAAAFGLKRQSDNAAVTLAAFVDNSGSGTVVTLTFTGGAVNAGSLADGRYTLTVLASQVTGPGGSLDGNGNGVGGDDYVLVGSPGATPRLVRLFGDNDGDGDVDAVDFGQFRAAFGGSANLAFDFDGDGDVDAVDFGQFRQRFGTSV